MSETATISWNRWHLPVKKDFTSLCKWQSGMRFQAWVEDKVWQAKAKEKQGLKCVEYAALTCNWRIVQNNWHAQTQAKNKKDCQQAPTHGRLCLIANEHRSPKSTQFMKAVRGIDICQNESQILYIPKGGHAERPTKPALPNPLSGFDTAHEGVWRVSDSFLQRAYSWAYP